MDWVVGLFARERRGAKRRSVAGLAAFYWAGGQPTPHQVRDISSSGVYLVTEDRWCLGTMLLLTLQESKAANGAGRAIRVQSRVIRSGKDGVGFALVVSTVQSIDGAAGQKEWRSFFRSLPAI